MKILEKSIKKRYLLFVSTFILIILTMLFISQHSISSQISDAHLINVSGRQRMLSQNITKLSYQIGYSKSLEDNTIRVTTLDSLLSEWDKQHKYLHAINDDKWKSKTIDSLLNVNEFYQKQIFQSGLNIVKNHNTNDVQNDIDVISQLEDPYLHNTDILVNEYQKATEEHLKSLQTLIYIFVVIAFIVVLSEFLLILMPSIKEIFKKNKELLKKNKDLAISEEKLKTSMLELSLMKSEVEDRETFYKTFIEQIPTAIAMLDNDLCYIAVSKTWIKDYKLEGKEIIGRSHYEVFPEIGEDWKEKNRECLKGAIDICDEAPFVRADGTVQWIQWDSRPWFQSDGSIGGLVMHTADITKIKENESEKKRVERILKKTNQIARIGAWEVDLVNNKSYLSDVVREIYGISKDAEISPEAGLKHYREGKSRNAIEKALDEVVKHGKPYDLEVELINVKGETKWVRTTGQAEIVNDQCVRIYGLFQDINNRKLAQLALHKAHTELKAIFNSNAVSIITTDLNGVINQFNPGAEALTGYAATEIIGKENPLKFHAVEEYMNFVKDIAELYDKDPKGFDPQLEMALNNAYDTREWNYVRKDGATLPVQLTLTSFKDENNVHIGYLGVAMDISDKKIAEKELLRKNKILNFAEEITHLGNFQVDVINDRIKWSDNLYKILGFNKNVEITLRTYLEYTHPADKERVAKHMNNTLEEKVFENLVHRVQLEDGTVKIVHLLGQVLTDTFGNIIEVIGTCQDITDQKLVEIDILRKNYLLNFAERITHIGNFQWDIPSDTLIWSSNMYRIFEYDESNLDLNYNSFFDQIHPEDKDYITRLVKESFDNKKFASDFIHRIVTSNGTIKTVQFFGEVILNEQSEVVEMMGACQDITEQKAEEKKFKGLLESAPDAMVIVNETGEIQLINRQLEKLFGYTTKELLNKSVEILIPEQLSGINRSEREQFFSKLDIGNIGIGNEKEILAKHKNGLEIPIQISVSPLKTDEGLLISIAIRDITGQKIAQKKILDAKENLEILTKNLLERNNQLADFAQITSHNLRAPVSNLNSLLGFYQESTSNEEKSLLMGKFEIVINHLTLTLNSLLEALKIRNDKTRIREEILFEDVFSNTADILSGEILFTKANIKTNFNRAPKINYNKIYLESIFLNLVSNALKYKSKNRIPEIIIESEIVKGKTTLKISDNGLGINLDRHGDKIFGLNKVFHRHNDAKGIGLFLTRTQVESMGGKITVNSKVNEGTTFTIIF